MKGTSLILHQQGKVSASQPCLGKEMLQVYCQAFSILSNEIKETFLPFSKKIESLGNSSTLILFCKARCFPEVVLFNISSSCLHFFSCLNVLFGTHSSKPTRNLNLKQCKLCLWKCVCWQRCLPNTWARFKDRLGSWFQVLTGMEAGLQGTKNNNPANHEDMILTGIGRRRCKISGGKSEQDRNRQKITSFQPNPFCDSLILQSESRQGSEGTPPCIQLLNAAALILPPSTDPSLLPAASPAIPTALVVPPSQESLRGWHTASLHCCSPGSVRRHRGPKYLTSRDCRRNEYRQSWTGQTGGQEEAKSGQGVFPKVNNKVQKCCCLQL